jgi:hypothetical protein
MPPLPLLADEERPPMRVRTVGCPCDPNCTGRFVIASTAVRPDLWVVASYAENEDDAVHEAAVLLANAGRGDDYPFLVIEQACYLIGRRWEDLTADVGQAIAAFVIFARLPEWMFAVPTWQVRATRKCVFGDDLVRVPRALELLDEYYVPERPVVVRGA